jgi:lipid-A-disaccharide synthase-like uncharacterized protein
MRIHEVFKTHFRPRGWQTKPFRIFTGTAILVLAQLQGYAAAQRQPPGLDATSCPATSHARLASIGLSRVEVPGGIERPIMVSLRSPILRVSELLEVASHESKKETAPSPHLGHGSARKTAWVVFGLFGQMLFAARMLIQWIASEKRRQPVIPVAFWWFSVLGGIMLVIYFTQRRDIVGVLGQFLPLIIYLRNLYFIYRNKKPTRPATKG